MSASVIVVTPEQLAQLIRDAVAAELDARGLKAPEPEPDVFESIEDFMEKRMDGLSRRAGLDWKAKGKLVCVGEGKGLRVDVRRTLEKLRESKKSDTKIEDLARRTRRGRAA